ncbi:hypothetical protein Tco_1156518 [Tanacetum coccineum]
MPPRMTTRSAGRQTAAPRGGRTGRQTGRGGGRTREPMGRVGGRTGDRDGQGDDQGVGENEGVDELPDFSTVIAQQLQDLLPTSYHGDVRSANVSNGRNGCSYKEFIACNPKDYDGKGGAIVYNRWIEKMKSVQDMSGCRANQKVKYTTGLFIAGHAAYTDRFRKLASLVPHLVILENKRIERYIYGLALQICTMVAATKPTTIQSVVLKAGMLIDEAIRNGSLKKNTEKRGNSRELSRKENVRDDNKRSRTGRVFATIINPVRKEYMGTTPECTNRSFHYNPEMPCHKMVTRGGCLETPRLLEVQCFECGGTDHYKSACPWLNRAPRPGGNHQNQPMAIEGGQGRGHNGKQARGGAFMMGVEEARQDPKQLCRLTFTKTTISQTHYSILVPTIALFLLLSYLC